jgi:hypothetical protein
VAKHESARDHVVKRLTTLGKTRHNEADTEWNQTGDKLGEEPPGGSAERDSLSR